jgi:hypothetical protein
MSKPVTLRPKAISSNFRFLAPKDERLAILGALAEQCVFDDVPSALFKLRQLRE